MARTRTIKVTLTFADDADAAAVDASVESIVKDLNDTVQHDYTRAGADSWGKHEGVPSTDFAFAESATVEHAVTLSERVERASIIHFGSPAPVA